MLLTENTTNDTCQSNLRGAWNDVSTGDTKIEVIECEFPICIYLICDTASSESGTRNLLGACRHKVVVSGVPRNSSVSDAARRFSEYYFFKIFFLARRFCSLKVL